MPMGRREQVLFQAHTALVVIIGLTVPVWGQAQPARRCGKIKNIRVQGRLRGGAGVGKEKMPGMPRKRFDQELTELHEELAGLGNQVDDRMEKTILALRSMDLELAREVAGSDNEIDHLEHQLESECLSLIALQQPIAKDLRVIAACLKVLTDIEREADQCADICEIICTGELNPNSLVLSHVLQMMEAARTMFRRAMNVFISRDVAEAEDICRSDDFVDNLFSKVILEVSAGLRESANVLGEVDLLLITKYAERMADHATNIAEWVIYIETGEHPDLNHEQTEQEPV